MRPRFSIAWIDTPSGHIIGLFVLLAISIVSYRNGFPQGGELAIAAFGALLMKFGGSKSEPKP